MGEVPVRRGVTQVYYPGYFERTLFQGSPDLQARPRPAQRMTVAEGDMQAEVQRLGQTWGGPRHRRLISFANDSREANLYFPSPPPPATRHSEMSSLKNVKGPPATDFPVKRSPQRQTEPPLGRPKTIGNKRI